MKWAWVFFLFPVLCYAAPDTSLDVKTFFPELRHASVCDDYGHCRGSVDQAFTELKAFEPKGYILIGAGGSHSVKYRLFHNFGNHLDLMRRVLLEVVDQLEELQ